MARSMSEKNTGIYRTVVKTTWVKDSKETYRSWNDGSYGEIVPHYKVGDTVTEVFGPYVSNAQNQNYSIIDTVKYEDLGEKYPDDYGYAPYRGQPKSTRVVYAYQKTQSQRMEPVLALQPSGSLKLELDWVDY